MTGAPSTSGPSRWARLADSDLFYSFIHSPVTVIAALVTLTIFTAALLAPVIGKRSASGVVATQRALRYPSATALSRSAASTAWA